MEILCVGCGNAFSKKNYNLSFLLKEKDQNGNERKMLIDMGYQTGFALDNLGIDLDEIDDVYISHLHSDHCGFLEPFGFYRYDWMERPRSFKDFKNCKPPKLYCEQVLMNDLWEHTLKGGMQTLEGFNTGLDTFFELHPIDVKDSFKWQGWKFTIIQQAHIIFEERNHSSYGLILEKEDCQTVYFTTDSQDYSSKQINTCYEKADIIFQDAELIGVNMKEKSYVFSSGSHANYAQLAGYKNANSAILSSEIKKKMFLCHYQDIKNENKDYFGNDCDWEKTANEDGFAGFVHVGDIFILEKGNKKPLINRIADYNNELV